ncbi:MAG: hypothetical protein AAB365_00765 [Patescibacteria group bacterium]
MKEIIQTLRISMTTLLIVAVAFFTLEPAVSNAIEDQFTVTQVVTAEISFLTPSSDIVMSPQLAGITGGTSNGSTYVRVLTNNALGYSMTLTSSSSLGMIGNTQGGNIPAYTPATGIVPDFSFSVPVNRAEFGYTVEASTTPDLAQAFLDNGTTTCDTGSADTVDACWVNASTSARTIINRTTETAASGATTTIKFRVTINSNPSPAVPQDTYVATTTLTATTN